MPGWTPSGPIEPDSHFLDDTGLTGTDLADISAAYAEVYAETKAAIFAAGGFTWQDFVDDGTAQGPLVHQASCASDLRAYCGRAPDAGSTLLYGLSCTQDKDPLACKSALQDIASFLLIRGDFAYIGYTWSGCRGYFRPPELDTDTGAPLGACAETAPGSEVFVREYARASVSMNCSSWTASIEAR